jgi:hypothetical protein
MQIMNCILGLFYQHNITGYNARKTKQEHMCTCHTKFHFFCIHVPQIRPTVTQLSTQEKSLAGLIYNNFIWKTLCPHSPHFRELVT